jgi:hypothetical protein
METVLVLKTVLELYSQTNSVYYTIVCGLVIQYALHGEFVVIESLEEPSEVIILRGQLEIF